MLRFRLFNIPIGIHWSFWLLVTFLGGGMSANETHEWHRVLVFVVAAFISILVHELGHAIAGLKAGAQQTQIQLYGMGGAAMFNGRAFSRWQSIGVSFAGPASSIILGVLFALVSMNVDPSLFPHSYGWMLFMYFIRTLFFINIFWAIFNLCPVMPLDGGQILRSLLGPKRMGISLVISFVFLVIMGVTLWIVTRSLYNLFLVVIFGVYNWQLYQQSQR